MATQVSLEAALPPLLPPETGNDWVPTFVSGALAEADFHNNVMSSTAGWQEWQPDDPVKRLLKQAIDNTAKKFA